MNDRDHIIDELDKARETRDAYMKRIADLESELLSVKTECDNGLCPSSQHERMAATRRIAELEAALHEYGEHDGRCVLARFTAGRPMPGGGYEMEYDRVWYEVKPVDRRPPCTCGFSAALAGSTALRDFVRPLLVESAREAANDTGYEDRVNEDDVADRVLKEAGL